MSHGWPARWTGTIAFVRSVTSSATRSGSRFKSLSRTSAKTGVAPAWTITFAVAGHVIGLVITSSPGPTPRARSERWSAAVPEDTASTCRAPRYSRNRSSSSAVRGPVVSQPERRVSATAAISSSPIAGGWNERKDARRAPRVLDARDLAQLSLRRDEELRAGAAGSFSGLDPRRLPDRGREGGAVQVEPARRVGELRVVASAEPGGELDDLRAVASG